MAETITRKCAKCKGVIEIDVDNIRGVIYHNKLYYFVKIQNLFYLNHPSLKSLSKLLIRSLCIFSLICFCPSSEKTAAAPH